VTKIHAERDRTFGNARTMRNLFESAVSGQALRLSQLGRPPTMQELQALCAQDLEAYGG